MGLIITLGAKPRGKVEELREQAARLLAGGGAPLLALPAPALPAPALPAPAPAPVLALLGPPRPRLRLRLPSLTALHVALRRRLPRCCASSLEGG